MVYFSWNSHSNVMAADVKMLFVLLLLVISAINNVKATQRRNSNNIILAFTDEMDASKLRESLNIRDTGVRNPQQALRSEGLAKEIEDTLKYLDDIEREHMNMMDTVQETARVSELQNRAEAGTRDFSNSSLAEIERIASRTMLRNQRIRNRSNRRQAHRGMTNAVRLSNDYGLSSLRDSNDRIQNARHESIASRARNNADIRDALYDVRGRQYEDRLKDITNLRNKLNAARSERLTSTLEANAAVRKNIRQNAMKRRLERLYRLTKAREAYAKAFTEDV